MKILETHWGHDQMNKKHKFVQSSSPARLDAQLNDQVHSHVFWISCILSNPQSWVQSHIHAKIAPRPAKRCFLKRELAANPIRFSLFWEKSVFTFFTLTILAWQWNLDHHPHLCPIGVFCSWAGLSGALRGELLHAVFCLLLNHVHLTMVAHVRLCWLAAVVSLHPSMRWSLINCQFGDHSEPLLSCQSHCILVVASAINMSFDHCQHTAILLGCGGRWCTDCCNQWMLIVSCWTMSIWQWLLVSDHVGQQQSSVSACPWDGPWSTVNLEIAQSCCQVVNLTAFWSLQMQSTWALIIVMLILFFCLLVFLRTCIFHSSTRSCGNLCVPTSSSTGQQWQSRACNRHVIILKQARTTFVGMLSVCLLSSQIGPSQHFHQKWGCKSPRDPTDFTSMVSSWQWKSWPSSCLPATVSSALEPVGLGAESGPVPHGLFLVS